MGKPQRKKLDEERPGPFDSWILTVDSQHRIRAPAELSLMTGWLRKHAKSVACRCFVGPIGGIRIVPTDGQNMVEHRRVLTMLARDASPLDEPTSELTAYARYFSTSAEVSIRLENNRLSFTIPERVRKLRVAPSSGETAVAFATRNMLEIWPCEQWLSHVRAFAGEYADQIAVLAERAEEH